MFGKLTTSSYKREAPLTSNIAFLPAVISVAFLCMGLLLLYIEATPYIANLEKRLPPVIVPGKENARSILNIIANGIISLTVFSFSMVMVVLSQASSTQSPRIIPGLTTARSHQVVLGFYIGTIIYTLLLLLNFEKVQSGEKETPAIAILLSMAFAITCLVLFVYFIHSISKAVQVDNIMNSIFLNAKNALQLENDVAQKTKSMKVNKVRELNYTLNNLGNGYLKRVDLTELRKIAREYDLQIEIAVEVGAFIVEGQPLIRLSANPKESEELRQQQQDCFDLSQKEIVMEDYEQGVKQISEIAVKALSPGINDPGTAIKAIDFLTLLFIYKIRSEERNCLMDEENNLRVIEKNITLDELLHRYLSPIRTYGKGDLQINLRLLRCLNNMLHQNPYHRYEPVICRHAQAVVYDAERNVQNPLDRVVFNEAIQQFNEVASHQYQLTLLEVQVVYH